MISNKNIAILAPFSGVQVPAGVSSPVLRVFYQFFSPRGGAARGTSTLTVHRYTSGNYKILKKATCLFK